MLGSRYRPDAVRAAEWRVALHRAGVVPNCAGDGYVPNEILLDPTQNQLMATINRQALIVCFESLFDCVEIFADQLGFAKHLLKRWPHNEQLKQALADVLRVRGLN
jgi:hypothetical protein